MKNKRGFTLSELVIVSIVLFLLIAFLIIYPSLPSRCGDWSPRIQCASQLNGIGKAIALYQNEYRDQNPIVWGEKEVKGTFGMGLYNMAGESSITRWVDPNFDDWENQPTVGGCLYLLIKYEDLDPIWFLCPKAPDDIDMFLEDAVTVCEKNGWAIPETFQDLNDFQSMANLSYSYNDPWKAPLDVTAGASLALVADKSNAYDTENGACNLKAGSFPVQNKDGSWDDDEAINPRHGNSRNHGTEDQNVLFADTHVKKCITPTVGIKRDNIYTHWSGGEKSTEMEKMIGRWDKGHAVKKEDSYLGN